MDGDTVKGILPTKLELYIGLAVVLMFVPLAV